VQATLLINYLALLNMNPHGSVFLLPLAALAVVVVAHAEPRSSAAPERLVKAAVENVTGTIQSNPETRSGDLGKIIAVVQREFLPYTDFERTTRLALGPAWRDATPEQRQQLFEQFQALLVRSYALSLAQLREQNVQFRYLPLRPGTNPADVVVETRVLNNGEETEIDYRLVRTPAGWKIYDINMMGAWLIETYRRQFGAIVARSGVNGLLSYLRRHNAGAGAGG
jgi:phospholipid transport system substrate-binding protein